MRCTHHPELLNLGFLAYALQTRFLLFIDFDYQKDHFQKVCWLNGI